MMPVDCNSAKGTVSTKGKQGRIAITNASNAMGKYTGRLNDFRKSFASFQSIVHKTGQACLQKKSVSALKT
jgi:hypothetical protein